MQNRVSKDIFEQVYGFCLRYDSTLTNVLYFELQVETKKRLKLPYLELEKPWKPQTTIVLKNDVIFAMMLPKVMQSRSSNFVHSAGSKPSDAPWPIISPQVVSLK